MSLDLRGGGGGGGVSNYIPAFEGEDLMNRKVKITGDFFYGYYLRSYWG